VARATAAVDERLIAPVVRGAVAVLERLLRGAPAGFADIRVPGPDAEARAADRGNERARSRPVGRGRDAVREALVATVARREVDPDPFDRSLLDDLLVRLDVAGRQPLADPSVRVGDDVREVPVDDMVQRGVEVLVVVRRADVDDVSAGSHRVHRLDVERLLAVPALRILPRVLRSLESARRDDLVELALLEHENGPAFRKPNAGGASAFTWSGRTSAIDSSRPTTPSTSPVSDDGIVRSLEGARNVLPS
jgi:hypothetical protein